MKEENLQVRPLIDLIEETLSNDSLLKPHKPILDFISNDKECVEFMNNQLDTDMFTLHEEDEDLYKLAQNRARHSVITYLLGLVLAPFGNIIDIKRDGQLWLKLSMYHDYGYFSKYVKDSTHDLRTDVKYYLLDDCYEKELQVLNNWFTKHSEDFAFAYKEIEDYFEYSRNFHAEREKDKEKVDHGVLGGVLVFQMLASKLLKSEKINKSELYNIKTFCLAIAQHNMYRINGDNKKLAKGLRLEKLYEENSFRISRDTPLLLFLSLIDTVECVKKFSQSENDSKYFQTETTLKNLKLSVSEERIILDFSDLRKAAERDKKIEWFKKIFDGKNKSSGYVSGICNFGSWTVFQGYRKENDVLTITIK